MTDLSNKTYKAILEAMLQRIPDTYDKRDTSPIPTALGPAAWALEGFYVVLNSVQGQAFIQTATGESLENLAVIANLTRRGATPAVRIGVFDMAVPIGSRFSTINGADSINFTVTAGTGTPNQYELTADTPGSMGNDYTGPILPVTAIPGLTSASMRMTKRSARGSFPLCGSRDTGEISPTTARGWKPSMGWDRLRSGLSGMAGGR